jgi:hypothetical protein
VYAAGGYYEEGKGVRELVKEMEGYIGEGFRAVKMKVGGEPMDVDAERVRAVREGQELDYGVFVRHSSLAPALRKLTVTLPVRPS